MLNFSTPMENGILTMTDTSIARGEIWLVDFDPTIGQEIQKARPAVVISIGAAFRYSLRIVVPITTWQDKFAKDFWMIRLPPDSSNHLNNDSAANAFQIRCVSQDRFSKKLGVLTSEQVDKIAQAVAYCIGL